MVLSKEEAEKIIYPLSLNEVWGIGRRRYQKLLDNGMNTIADAVQHGPGVFQKLFGNYFGRMLHETTTGQDCAKVIDHTGHVPKEISYMHTFSDWTIDPERVKGEMAKAVAQLCYRMRGYKKRAKDYSGYIRFQDVTWEGRSFAFQTAGLTNLDDYVLPACIETGMPMVYRFLNQGHKVRGIGINTAGLDGGGQLELFFREDEKRIGLYWAVDKINNTFGLGAIMKASLKYGVVGKTHFLERNA